MKTIRTGTFETNSSSSHSLTISKGEAPQNPDVDFKGEPYNLYGGCYGWGYEVLTTPAEKINYIAVEATILNNETLKEWLEEIIQKRYNCGEVIFPTVDFTNSYIDHQSQGLIRDEFGHTSKRDLEKFIFSDSTIIIDNDNH